MKKLGNTLAIISLLFLASCGGNKDYYMFTSFHEPADEGLRYSYSEDGIHWDGIPGARLKPELGQHQLMQDPSMVRTLDGTYHLVWTTSWKGDLGLGYAHSKNLIRWSEQQIIPVMADEPITISIWAPEISYDDESDQFMVVWASCVPGRFEEGMKEENNNHRLYYIITEDFKTVSKAKLLYDPGFNTIDAAVVKRAKNDYVMVLEDSTRPERNLKIAFSDSMTGPYSPASQSFTESFVEGPSVKRLGDDYLIYFDVCKKGTYGAMRTKDFRNFIGVIEEVSIPIGHKHGTIFKAPESVIKALLEEKK